MCEDPRCGLSRRHLLRAGTAAVLAGAFATRAWAEAPALPDAPNAISPDEALKRLMAGNKRYAKNTSANKDFSAGRAARARVQYPFASILSCADSRVAPELAFDQGPGRLFVVRVAGNFVNEDGLASLEYGSKVLGVPLIMVLGHSNCGAVDSTLKAVKDGIVLPGHLPALVAAIRPAAEAAKTAKDPLEAAIAENVRLNVKRLAEATPILAPMVSEGKVKVVGAVYDLKTGVVAAV